MGEPRGILSGDSFANRTALERAEKGRDIPGENPPVVKTRKQIIEEAAPLKGTYNLNNGVVGKYEITKTDLHNLVYEMSKSLNSDRERIILNLRDIIENGEYVGWAKPDEGMHSETAFFTYYSKQMGQMVYVGMRYMKGRKLYKPYAIYSEDQFKKDRAGKIEKGTPTI